jgi:Tol biopolymer transport system component
MLRSAIVWIAVLSSSAAGQDPITRVSDAPDGTQGNWNTLDVAISADGNSIAFTSFSSNLVPDDNNAWADAGGDIFVRNRVTGAVVRVSVSSGGDEADGCSYAPAISADGRFVLFQSFADDLVPNDTNGFADLFVHDRDPDGNGVFDEGNGVTTRVNVASDGNESDADGYDETVSADGTLVCFCSAATNLVADDRNGVNDVFVRDLVAGTTTRVSLDSNGIEGDGESSGASISADGRYVVFTSVASNLVPNDVNGVGDVFLHDRVTGATTLVSLDSNGVQGNGFSQAGRLSADDRILGFSSYASNLVAGDTNGGGDCFLRDLTTGITTRVSVGTGGIQCNKGSNFDGMSADARFVVFSTASDNLVAGDGNEVCDAFVHDCLLDTTTLLSCSRTGEIGNDDNTLHGMGSFGGPMSADGRFVVLLSFASNLVSNDTNDFEDAFLRDLSISIDATWNNYGEGFAGLLGVPTLASSDDPVFGTTITLDVGNSSGAPTVGLLLIGFAPASIVTSAGGTILVDEMLMSPFALATTGASIVESIPYDDWLYGQSACLQALELDPGAAKRIAFTPGLELLFGR